MHRRHHRAATGKPWLLPIVALMLLAGVSPSLAQRAAEVTKLALLAPGTTLPVALDHGLKAGKSSSGSRIVAHTGQRVPVGPGLYLKSGAELSGVIVRSGPGDRTGEDVLRLRFDTLRYRGQTISVSVEAVATANFTEVAATKLPASGSTDRGNPNPASWTTRQVGGDEVYRSGWSGDVCDTVMHKVGFADYDGVYRLPAAAAPGDAPAFPEALGVFSASAAGLFGYDDRLSLASSTGVITIAGPRGRVALRSGDNLLLRVVEPQSPSVPSQQSSQNAAR